MSDRERDRECPPLKFTVVAMATFVTASLPSMVRLYSFSQQIPEVSYSTFDDDPGSQISVEIKMQKKCGGKTCHSFANCIFEDGAEHCICNNGYLGDGIWCGATEKSHLNTEMPSPLNTLHINAVNETTTLCIIILILNEVLLSPASEDLMRIHDSAKQLNTTADVVFVTSTSQNFPESIEDITVVSLQFIILPLQRTQTLHLFYTKISLPATTYGGLVICILEYVSPESHSWTFMLSAEYLISPDFGRWFPIGYSDLDPRNLINQTVTDSLAFVNDKVPHIFSKLQFHPKIRPQRGEGFLLIESESWMAASTASYIVFSSGFLQLFQSRGYTSKTVRKGLANADTCLAGIDENSIMNDQIALVSGCIYEQYGMQSKSLSDLIDITMDSKNSSTPVYDGWQVPLRHAEWNCTMSLPGHLHSRESVTAVCQQPLFKSVPPLIPGKMKPAPDEIGSLYKLYLAPKAALSKGNATSNTTSVSNTISWNIPSFRNSTFKDLPPIVIPEDAPRDAVFVVGAGEHMKLKPIEVFIRSLRSTGSQAEVVAFIDQRSISGFVPMANKYGGVRLISFDAEVLQNRYHSKKAVVIYRFVLYEHFLRSQPVGRYGKCLHADLFDTYFQRDPFSVVDTRGGMAVFTENPKVPMELCRYHRMWFGQCNEGHLLHRYHSIPRVCMGVVLADSSAFIKFLQLTLFRMLQYCNDQGVLNILLWSGQYAELMPVTIYTARDGPVFHANTEWEFKIDEDGMVLNSNGKPYTVVHQWDRLMKPHPTDVALHFNPRTDLDKRKAYLHRFWYQPKQSWENSRLVPSCNTSTGRANSEVICISGHRTKHGSKHAAFCPTHTSVRAVSTSLL